MKLTLREYRLYVSQCATLEQSLMYYDLEHKNIHYCNGSNLRDEIIGEDENDNEDDIASGKAPIADIAIADIAIVY